MNKTILQLFDYLEQQIGLKNERIKQTYDRLKEIDKKTKTEKELLWQLQTDVESYKDLVEYLEGFKT